MALLNNSATFASSLVAATSNCSAQLGDEYTGEVMLKLSGKVQLRGESHTDRVPSLAFVSEEGSHLAPGKAEGALPSKEQGGGEVCTRTETTCDEAGKCGHWDLSRKPDACTLLDATGDPESNLPGLRTGYALLVDQSPDSPEPRLKQVKCAERGEQREVFWIFGAGHPVEASPSNTRFTRGAST